MKSSLRCVQVIAFSINQSALRKIRQKLRLETCRLQLRAKQNYALETDLFVGREATRQAARRSRQKLHQIAHQWQFKARQAFGREIGSFVGLADIKGRPDSSSVFFRK